MYTASDHDSVVRDMHHGRGLGIGRSAAFTAQKPVA